MMKNLKYFKAVLIYSAISIIFSACQNQDYTPTRLSKRDLNYVNQAILEIVVPKKEDKRVIFERDLPWGQLSYKERMDKYHSIGTAFFISKTRLVSAAHVFALDDFSTWHDFYVRNTKGEVFPVNQFFKYSQYRDFVEFDLKEYPNEISPLKISEKVEIGDTVFAIGNAQGEGISVRGGQVASFTPESVDGKWNYIRFSSPASPGNSGRPLVNIHAEVVGLIVMKNSSENYNYALPISEIKNISNKTARFFENNVTVFDGTQTEVEDWQVEHPLPADTKTLAEISQKSKNDFYGYLLDKLKKSKGDVLFPKHEMFREYLRYQSLGKFFGSIQNNTSLNEWDVEHVDMKKIRLAPNQFLYIGKGKLGHYEAVIEKPQNMSLKDFINNSELHLELLARGMGFTRTIGKERIRIISYGEPDKKFQWKDELGRKWLTSYWFVTYNDLLYSLDCLPAPRGVACFFDIQDSDQFSKGLEHFKSYNVLEQTASYFGTLTQWEEFFNLGNEYLPDGFQLKNLNISKGISFELNDLSFNITNKKITKDAMLTVYAGYSFSEPIMPSIEAFSLQLDENEYEGVSLKRVFSPSDISSKAHRKKWKKVYGEKSPYNGVAHASDDIYYSKMITQKTNESVFILSCFTEKEGERNKLKKECLDQRKNIKKK